MFLPPAQVSYSGTPPQVSPVGSSEFAQPTLGETPLPSLAWTLCFCFVSLPGTCDLQIVSDVPEAGLTQRPAPHGLFTCAAQGGEGLMGPPSGGVELA